MFIDKNSFIRLLNQISTSNNNVSIKRLIQNPNKNKKISSIIIITHNSKDSSLNKIVKIIGKKIYVKKKPKLIRIDDN